jgi:hypothetical protein
MKKEESIMWVNKELIIGFAFSYLANNIPTLKERISKNKKFEDELENSYQKALKKWCKNDGIRKSMSIQMFRQLSNLKKYLQREEHIDEHELIELWAEELRNNQICYEFIVEQKIDAVFDEAHANNVILTGLDRKTDEILSKVVNDNVKVYQKIIQKYTISTECCKGTKSLLYITYC